MPLGQIKALPAVMRQAILGKPLDVVAMMKAIVGYATRARKEGLLVLEEEARQVNNEFLRLGLQLVVDGTPSELAREIMETEVEAMQARHRAGESIFSTMGGFAPTLGILGTVMGLVSMLASLSEPDKMGGAIANAFIATLYGVGLANLVFLPIGNKLKCRSQQEVTSYQLAIEGMLAIQAGENPRAVAARMRSFLSPKEKAMLEEGKE
jgi:chemotaxis protein MotA